MKNMVPEQYCDRTVEAVNRHLPKMTPEQEKAFEGFDIRPSIKTAETAGAIDWWQGKLEDLAKAK